MFLKTQLRPAQLIPTVLSAVLFSLSFTTSFVGFGFVSLLPLFYALQRRTSTRSAFWLGALFGFIAGLMLLSWAPGSLIHFFGGNVLIAWAFFLGGSLALGVQYGLMAWLSFFLWKKSSIYLLSALAVAAFWTLCEMVCTSLYSGAPWLQTSLYKGIAEADFLIQWAAMGGGSLVSFFLLLFQILILGLLRSKRKVALTALLATLCIFFLGNFFLQKKAQNNNSVNTISVAIINENTPADLKWTPETGDQMARNLLRLHAEGLRLNPDLLLWSESAVPWTFAPDDDFVQEILRGGLPQILGINSEYDGSMVYNSAYYLDPERPVQRYDKRYLLSFAEKPLDGGLLPFGEIAGFYVKEGAEAKVFSSHKGPIGALICNESFVPKAAYSLVQEGAQVLMLLSNDGWIDGSAYLLRQHWLSAKVRAVELARNVVVNCNLGYSGLIRADGSEAVRWRDKDGVVNKISAKLYDHQTIYSQFPSMSFLVFVCIFAICTLYLSIKR